MIKRKIKKIDDIKKPVNGMFELTKEQIVYKTCYIPAKRYNYYTDSYNNYATVKLCLPVGTIVNLTVDRDHNKCRASQAKVLEIKKLNRSEKLQKCYSTWDICFLYQVGDIVKPIKKFDTTHDTCASGIHFFRTLKEARNYFK